MHLFAYCSTRSSAWAKAFYDIRRDHGDTHAGALRKLADKWLKILAKMIETGEVYDEERYTQSLRNSGSPLYQKLCEQSCGKHLKIPLTCHIKCLLNPRGGTSAR